EQAAAIAEFVGREPRTVGAGRIDDLGARTGAAAVTARHHLGRRKRTAPGIDVFAANALLGGDTGFLGAGDIRILRPGRRIGNDGVARLRSRKRLAARDHQRRPFVIVDRVLAITLEADAFEEAAQDLGVDRRVV